MNAKIPGWFALHLLLTLVVVVAANICFGISEQASTALTIGMMSFAAPFLMKKAPAEDAHADGRSDSPAE